VNQTTKHDIKLEIDVRVQELITQSLLKEFPQHALTAKKELWAIQASEFPMGGRPARWTVNYYYGIRTLRLDCVTPQSRNHRRHNLRSDS
jgi:hypothetical protein